MIQPNQKGNTRKKNSQASPSILQKSDKGLQSPQWYRDAVIYEVRVQSFKDGNADGIGDFKGLAEELEYLEELGVDTLWLLPFYPSPLRDDGYDISDYLAIHPNLGTLAEFRLFLKEAHRRGLRVITELVLNHTSESHAWFQRARLAPTGSAEREYYVWSDDPNRYAEARIIFKDFERSNWTWDPIANAYYWHRFYSHQPDLNFESPRVQSDLLKVVDFWLDLGVDGLRLDAVPYLFEKDGTNCENLPETFQFLRRLRAHIDSNYTDRMLLAEANQWPEDAVRYLEGGDKCQMAFNFPLMPRMFLSLHMENRFPIVDILSQTPALPDNCQWALFLRNHDELTLEMVTDEERDYLLEAYAPESNMRINLGIRRRLAPLLENNRRKLELLNCLLFSLPGTPVLYYGDEIGMGDNTHLADRNGVRTPMQWSSDRNAGFSRANPQSLYLPVIVDPEFHYETVNVETQRKNANSLYWWNKKLISLRKRFHAFGRGSFEFLQPENHRILAYLREYQNERMLVVINLSRFAQYTELDLSRFEGMELVELFGNTPFPAVQGKPYPLTPGPHMVLWFSLQTDSGISTTQSPVSEKSLPLLESSDGPMLQRRDWEDFERVLLRHLPSCTWFRECTQSLKQIRVTQSVTLPIGKQEVQLLILRCQYESGIRDDFLLPVTAIDADRAPLLLSKYPEAAITRITISRNATEPDYLVDATILDEFWRELFKHIRKRPVRNNLTGSALLRADQIKSFPVQTGAEDRTLRLVNLMSNQPSAIFDEKYHLKFYRKIEIGVNPDLEICRFLSSTPGPALAPKVGGWVDISITDEGWTTLATLQDFMIDARDAWSMADEELGKFFDRALAEQTSSSISYFETDPSRPSWDQDLSLAARHLGGGFISLVELLGRRTAEMHLALGKSQEDPRFTPEGYGALYQRSTYQSMRNLALSTMRSLESLSQKSTFEEKQLAKEIASHEKTVLNLLEEFRHLPISVGRIRTHGDYKLEKVIFTGKNFIPINFEGETLKPIADRIRKRSPLRDVASMICSIQNLGFTHLKQRADEGQLSAGEALKYEPWRKQWSEWINSAFFHAYLKTAGGTFFVPTSKDELRFLVRVFMLEKLMGDFKLVAEGDPSNIQVQLQCLQECLHESSRLASFTKFPKNFHSEPKSDS